MAKPKSVLSMIIVLMCCVACSRTAWGQQKRADGEIPDWVVYPDEEWQSISPEEAGIEDPDAWNRWVEAAEERARGDTAPILSVFSFSTLRMDPAARIEGM